MTASQNPQLGFVFPGQGAQSIGMLGQLAQAHAVVGETFAEASDVLGYDLWALVCDGPEADLNQTDRTQPALLAASTSVWRVWQQSGAPLPTAMAGHSLGEYSALVCAGSLAFGDAVKLVQARGQYMQEAVPAGVGAMAAILGLDDARVEQLCGESAQGEVVSAANYNSPGQVVVAGNSAAVERAMVAAKAAGAKRAVPLAVSVPSHCALMEPAAERLRADLEALSITLPEVPVYHNVDAVAAESIDALKQALVAQLFSPVRWTQCVSAMAATGVTTLVEAGPGKVLAGLNRRIDKTLTTLPAGDPAGLEKAIAAATL